MRYCIFVASLFLGLASCTGQDESCDAVRSDMENLIGQVCSQPDYKFSPFCSVCVAAEYYGIGDSCSCQPLTLNADFCYAPSNDVAISAVQNAVDQANQACPHPTVPYRDAGSLAADAAVSGDAM